MVVRTAFQDKAFPKKRFKKKRFNVSGASEGDIPSF
jgi:hypothetical protein